MWLGPEDRLCRGSMGWEVRVAESRTDELSLESRLPGSPCSLDWSGESVQLDLVQSRSGSRSRLSRASWTV
jgi:hypothetical protein